MKTTACSFIMALSSMGQSAAFDQESALVEACDQYNLSAQERQFLQQAERDDLHRAYDMENSAKTHRIVKAYGTDI